MLSRSSQFLLRYGLRSSTNTCLYMSTEITKEVYEKTMQMTEKHIKHIAKTEYCKFYFKINADFFIFLIYVLSFSSASAPQTFTAVSVGDNEPAPRKSSDIARLSGTPPEHQRRTVVVRQAISKSTMSGPPYGEINRNVWQIVWKPLDTWGNPLMYFPVSISFESDLSYTYNRWFIM